MVANGRVSEVRVEGTPAEIAAGEARVEWSGEYDNVVFLGYPFLTKHERWVPDDETGKLNKVIDPVLLDIGIPIKILYWSPTHHCFACVRSDVYGG